MNMVVQGLLLEDISIFHNGIISFKMRTIGGDSSPRYRYERLFGFQSLNWGDDIFSVFSGAIVMILSHTVNIILVWLTNSHQRKCRKCRKMFPHNDVDSAAL